MKDKEYIELHRADKIKRVSVCDFTIVPNFAYFDEYIEEKRNIFFKTTRKKIPEKFVYVSYTNMPHTRKEIEENTEFFIDKDNNVWRKPMVVIDMYDFSVKRYFEAYSEAKGYAEKLKELNRNLVNFEEI